MIDYEKLKEEIDLIHKRMYVQKDETLNEDAKALCVSICHSLDRIYTCLNELIARDVPKPKYEVGQKVYLMGDDNNPVDSLIIDEVIYDEGEYWCLVYTDDGQYQDEGRDFNQYRESALYPSAIKFINSQIKYWVDVKDKQLSGHMCFADNGDDIEKRLSGSLTNEGSNCEHDYAARSAWACVKCGDNPVHDGGVTE